MQVRLWILKSLNTDWLVYNYYTNYKYMYLWIILFDVVAKSHRYLLGRHSSLKLAHLCQMKNLKLANLGH